MSCTYNEFTTVHPQFLNLMMGRTSFLFSYAAIITILLSVIITNRVLMGKTHPQWICERNQVEVMRSTLKICLSACLYSLWTPSLSLKWYACGCTQMQHISEVDDYGDGSECLSCSCLCVILSCPINTVVLTVFHFWNTHKKHKSMRTIGILLSIYINRGRQNF